MKLPGRLRGKEFHAALRALLEDPCGRTYAEIAAEINRQGRWRPVDEMAVRNFRQAYGLPSMPYHKNKAAAGLDLPWDPILDGLSQLGCE